MSPSTDPHADAAEGARSDTPMHARTHADAAGTGTRGGTRRRLLVAAAAAPVVALAPAAHAQGRWPDKPIRFVVPFPPGGNSDILARTLADRLREHLKATVVVDNRPGGTTQIGTEAVARSEPDGYTMLLAAATSFTVLPNLRKLPYDLATDFDVAGGIADYMAIVTARKGLGVKTIGELVELAKKQPGKLTWGSAGNASAGHIYGEQLKKHAGIDMLHVPFKGSADASTALVGEQIDLIIDGVGLGLARSGRAVALATFFAQRHPELPDVPAITETGVKVELPAGGWGVTFPKGTPAPILAQVSAALEKTLAEPETREKLMRASVVALWTPPADYRRALDGARVYYGDLLRSIGMKEGS
ncbi:MAG: tripartite tricarboxylate transporter substrate binding protein [Burkholderiales bacterium]|nr:MAG: tripartite tricarboxylate transporter substrate binding protein [Burkholderiales bacterium]